MTLNHLLDVIAAATILIAVFTAGMEIGWYRGEDWGRKMARLEDLAVRR